jgi:hypothetical protein
MTTELDDHYRNTTYLVHLPPQGSIPVRIGEINDLLDRLLTHLGVREWAFITAWNPGSFILPPLENARNNSDLLERLTKMGYIALPGVGVGDEGDWTPEESFFIPGIARDEAIYLGRFYRQRAIVVGRVGEGAELVWC